VNVVLLIILAGLMHATRSFTEAGGPGSAGVTLALGYMLLTAFFAGGVFKQLRLPRLTGYIVAGVVVGPSVLQLVSTEMVERLGLVNGMAISLIALTAGSELELRAMRPLLRAIRWITLVGVLGTALLLSLAAWLARPLLPFMQGMTPLQAVAVSLVLGAVMVAQSPAVVVALRDELRADGPVARTVLGVVVLADLVVIVLFAITSTIAKGAFGVGADTLRTAQMLGWEIFGSLAAGVVVGLVLALYLRKIRGGAWLFLLAVTFVVAEVGQRLHLDPLLVALAAGVLVRNATPAGDDLHREIQASSLPVYVLFFAVAGANLHLGVLAVVGVPAALFVLVRGGGLLLGSWLGARLAGAPRIVQSHAGFGLLPQAGLALALSMMFAKAFPEFGAEAGGLTFGVVALNELLAPAAYRLALVRSGEAGRTPPARTPAPVAHPEPERESVLPARIP
jgi:Kef-type K+ transport system membrane component KefB